MATAFTAGPQQLQAAATKVEDAAQKIEGLRKGVESHVNELLGNGGWYGQAATRYRKHMGDWDRACKIILADLERIYDTIRLNSKNYESAEAEAQNIQLGDVPVNSNAVDQAINVRA